MLSDRPSKAEHQQRAQAEGARFEKECVEALERFGFPIVGTHVLVRQCGIRLDILTVNQHGVYLPCECKGGLGVGEKAPGFLSSDNVKKAIGSATSLAHAEPWIDAVATPMIVFTSFLSRPPTNVFDQFANLPVTLIADVLHPQDYKALKMWANMTPFGLEAYLHDTTLLAFRLFGNEHWHLHGTAGDYFAKLSRQRMVNLWQQTELMREP